MVRVGILGAESSHAWAFGRYYRQQPQEGLLVTAILDDCPEAHALAKELDCALVPSPAALAAQVDAAMITARRGSAHLDLARPLAMRGMPIFVDKPFTANLEEARTLAQLLADSGCKVMGGSGCRLSPDVVRLRQKTQALRAEGTLVGGSLSFGIDLNSPYDGFYFYAPHLIEMALEIFGNDPIAVSAQQCGAHLTAILRYDTFSVSLHFLYASQAAACTLYTDQDALFRTIDISQIFGLEAQRFAALVQGTEKGLTREALIRPNCLMDAIVSAWKEGRETPIPLP